MPRPTKALPRNQLFDSRYSLHCRRTWSDFNTYVVPAKAGTHNHRPSSLQMVLTPTVQNRKAAAYRSLRSQGRQNRRGRRQRLLHAARARRRIDSPRPFRCNGALGVLRSPHEATCPSIASRISHEGAFMSSFASIYSYGPARLIGALLFLMAAFAADVATADERNEKPGT